MIDNVVKYRLGPFQRTVKKSSEDTMVRGKPNVTDCSSVSSCNPRCTPSIPINNDCAPAKENRGPHQWTTSPNPVMEHQENLPESSLSMQRCPQSRSFKSIHPFSILFTPHHVCLLHMKSFIKMYLLMTFLIAPSLSFNVDLKTAVIHEGKGGSMFGYAVAQHIDQSTNWLLIGAPREQTKQRNIARGGAVFRCKTDRVNSCQRIPFDNTGNNIRYDRRLDDYMPIEEKSNQWFGATIESSGENGVIVACAPRYVYFSSTLDKREPVGMCWVAKTSTTKYEKYSPCAKGMSGFTKQGFCQAGFSAALSNDGRRLMIAAPGSWYWQGQMFVYDAVTRRARYTNKEGDSDTDQGYRGYSSAIGKFDADDEDDYVVGVPKRENYVGLVQMYTQNMTFLGSIKGDQIGSYFGGTLAVADINGDSLDDVIVGAPFYNNFHESGTWDTGRVYIYYQTSENKFKPSKRDILDGRRSRSRFGMALSKLGDINLDGYDDLCVGAPYDGEDENGAIYIYHGSTRGIITEPSQIVYASDFKTPLSTFGAAVSAGVDQDDNSFPDILVGAYDSDKAVFLRSRPIVHVYATLVLEPEKIDLEKKNCTLQDATLVNCLTVYTCIIYKGIGVPKQLYFDLKWTLDAKDGNNSNAEQRAFYITHPRKSTEKKTVKAQKEKKMCLPMHGYIKNNLKDKLTPIRTTLDFKLNLKKQSHKPRRKRELQPILNARIPKSTSFTIEILKNCGPDGICVPDLHVSYIITDSAHVAGSTVELQIIITVKNTGEDSFNTKLYIQMPRGVEFKGKSGEQSEVPITCSSPEKENSLIVVCDMGNPMTKDAKSEFTLHVKPTNSKDLKDTLDFLLSVNSSNSFDSRETTFSIPVTADAQINLFGHASPSQVNVKEVEADGKGKLIKHTFELISHGVTYIDEAELQVQWPSRDKSGQPALVLDGPLQVEGNGNCEIIIITPSNFSLYLGHSKPLDKSNVGSEISCSGPNKYCTFIQCLIGYMAPYSKFALTVNSRLKIKSFLEADHSRNEGENKYLYNFISVANARVRSVPYDFKYIDESKFPNRRIELETKLNAALYKTRAKGSPMWIYAVAAASGLFVLMVLVLLLWHFGFFRRKKPDTAEGYFAVNGKNDIDNKYVD